MFELGGLTSSDRPQSTAALSVSGSGDSLTAAPTWSDASILTATPAGNIAIDVAGCPDGGTRALRLTPANTKTVTLSATGGTIERQGGLDLNPITGDGTSTWTVYITRAGTVYGCSVVLGESYT